MSDDAKTSAPHPNLALLSRLDLSDLDASAGLFSEHFTWHYFNPNLPELAGDYHGLAGPKTVFKSIAAKTDGTFAVAVVSAIPAGAEFIVVHVLDSLQLDGRALSIDAIVVWRVIDGRIAEVWDSSAVVPRAG